MLAILEKYNYSSLQCSVHFSAESLKNGFYSQEYYSETFKKIMGVKPITYKKYINYDKSVSYKEIDIILNNLINLKDIVNKKENYLHNFLSQDHEQVLSIFR